MIDACLRTAFERGMTGLEIKVSEGRAEMLVRRKGVYGAAEPAMGRAARQILAWLLEAAGVEPRGDGPEGRLMPILLDGLDLDLRLHLHVEGDSKALWCHFSDPRIARGDWSALGFSPSAQARLDQVMLRCSGLVVVAGADKDAREVTLHAFAHRLRELGRRVALVESEAPRLLDGVDHQVAAEPLFGIDCALGAALRRDPEVLILDGLPTVAMARTALEASARRLVVAGFPAATARGARGILERSVGRERIEATEALFMGQELDATRTPRRMRTSFLELQAQPA